MHPPNPTNAPDAPQTAHVRASAPVSLPDGRLALVLHHAPADGRGLALAGDQLAAALSGTTAEVVLLVPEGTDVAALLAPATASGAAAPVLATAADVVDAVKQVDGDRVVGTVDRGGLRWATTPAVLARPHLSALVADAVGGAVRPLAGPVTWLPARSGR